MARLLFLATVVLLLGSAAAGKNAAPAKEAPAPVTLRTVVAASCQEIQRYAESLLGTGVIRSTAERAVAFLDSMLGQENVYSVAMFFETVIRCLAEGAASGLNVIAVYVTEILRVTGFDVAMSLPHFTPEGVTAVAQWGLLTLIGYWLLTMVLRLLVGVVCKVFWVIKTVLALWLFGLIVADRNASADTTAVRLAGLVLGWVTLNLITASSQKSCGVETRLHSLEGRVRAVEKRKAE
ncbi:uncharacterized protein LOC128767388 isoform X1 [Synchiropus splendidus]|uniref:uncharacterized protein LOC128767388 isoform X1 n=1 Tax=Synchiropus splendidus TaxID=270530 RepID=UPI00237DC299|nr:uncharacterized protein LOC128767388 isoform X1 [Synchiropus splendidus]